MLEDLIDKEFPEFLEKTKDKATKAVLSHILSKCREVKKLLKFSKTQILYDKNLKMVQSTQDLDMIDGVSVTPTGEF